MIPRYQRILFWILAGSIVLMALVLLHGCEQAREKLTRHRDETPLAAPVATPSETVHLAMADDADGSITLVTRELSLPGRDNRPGAHPARQAHRRILLQGFGPSARGGPAIDDVFLLDLPLRTPVAPGSNPDETNSSDQTSAATPPPQSYPQPDLPSTPDGQLAVINLHGTFADHHPSGIEPETLTIDSIIGTLYANFPRIEQVRFLVDGRPRDTLNGHADLTRIYPVVNTATNKTAQETPQ